MDRFYWVALSIATLIEAIALYKGVNGAALAAFFGVIGLLIGRRSKRSR